MSDCLYCGDELLPAHKDFGICCWCLKESNDRQKQAEGIKVPSYCGDDYEEHEEDENLPTVEEYM